MAFEIGYNTNGFAHHRLTDAIDVLARIGYESVAITLDHGALDPFDRRIDALVRETKEQLQSHNMCCVIETGARFLLDPRRKHWPSLVTRDEESRARRIDLIGRSMEIAAQLNAEAVSMWSGPSDPNANQDESWSLLVDACDYLLTRAVMLDVRLAFEPEPGMFIERMDQYRQLSQALNHPQFGLTLDVGHLHCLSDGYPVERIGEFASELMNIHIEDMKAGEHNHLMFGEGEIEFGPILTALQDAEYSGTVNVELSRHSHDAVNAAQKAFEFLSALRERHCGKERTTEE